MRVLELFAAVVVTILVMGIITPFVFLGAMLYIMAGSIAVGKDLSSDLLQWLQDVWEGRSDGSR